MWHNSNADDVYNYFEIWHILAMMRKGCDIQAWQMISSGHHGTHVWIFILKAKSMIFDNMREESRVSQ